MYLMEHPTFKTKYHKYKVRVKLWERDFMEKYGRRPTKNDIKAADITIRDAYKVYWNLKTKALEETLTEITFNKETEGNILPDANQSDEKDKRMVHSIPIYSENVYPGSYLSNVETVSISLKDELSDKGALDLCLTDEHDLKKNQTILVDKSSSFQLSQKMFKSLNFSKRNPRKSTFSAKLQKSEEKLDIFSSQLNKNNFEKDEYDSNNILESFTENLKFICAEKKMSSGPTNTIQQLIEKCSPAHNRQLNNGWLSRCTNDTTFEKRLLKVDTLSGNSYSELKSLECTHPSKESKLEQNLLHDILCSDDEDYVCNSDSEEERKNKRVRNSKKIIDDNDLHPVKRMFTDDQTDFYEVKVDNQHLQYELNDINKCTSLKEKTKTLDQKIVKELREQTYNSNQIWYSKDDPSCEEIELEQKQSAKKFCSSKENCTSNSMYLTKTKMFEKNKSFEENEKKNENENWIQDNIKTRDHMVRYDEKFIDIVPQLDLDFTASNNFITDFSCLLKPSKIQVESAHIDSLEIPSNKKERFGQKITTGKINENFVRINLKRKVFVRGKKSFNFSKYKKNQWKERKKELSLSENNLEFADFIDKNGILCSKCQKTGHFARQCKNSKDDGLLSLDLNSDISDCLSLQEIEQMAKFNVEIKSQSANIQLRKSLFSNVEKQNVEELDIEKCSETNDGLQDKSWVTDNSTTFVQKIPQNIIEKLFPQTQEVHPVYELEKDGSIKDTPLEVLAALQRFGHSDFREGQEEAIMRILSGQSTLVTLATGSGKSLCYQLPAYIYGKKFACITLVVSPLVSLMDDQVSGIPDFLPAACLHTNQSPKLRAKILENLKERKLNILLVSPEAIVAGDKSTGLGSMLRELPPIAFVCIDEAHCTSQWSHNFRPSYLMVCKVLRDKLGVKRFLGLTATASKTTTTNIVNLLNIKDGLAGVIAQRPLPSNLILTISKDGQREEALIRLLRSKRFAECYSTIIYCTRREECVRVAGLLRVSLQEFESKRVTAEQKKIKLSTIAEVYHAGLTSHRRKLVQAAFMKSETRIIVATVAFGMGINKPDIRSVIHFNMPASFESYVQEVGRAGRDGFPAHCHLFLSPMDSLDEYELRRHINANRVDRHTIRRLLQKIFIPCCCVSSVNSTGNRCPGHEVAFSIDETVKALDITEEMIATLLCYLELHPKSFIKLLPSTYVFGKVSSYNGCHVLKLAAQSSPPLAMAIALSLENGSYHEGSSAVEFPVIDIATAIGWDSGLVKNQLKNLEWINVNGNAVRSGLSVTFHTLGFRVKAPGDLTNQELDEALEIVTQQNESQATLSLRQLKLTSVTSRKFSFATVRECCDISKEVYLKSEEFKSSIRTYFELDDPFAIISVSLTENKLDSETQVIADIRSLILSYQDNNFTGRSIARIFHGIQSPNYPAIIWSKCRFWRAHLNADFNIICRLAAKEILKMK